MVLVSNLGTKKTRNMEAVELKIRTSINDVRIYDRITYEGKTYANIGNIKRGDGVEACVFENIKPDYEWLKVNRDNFKKFTVEAFNLRIHG